MDQQELDNRFTYHAPFGDQAQRYRKIRAFAKSFANFILAMTPESREQALAITKLEEVMMWANAAIARREDAANNAD